MNMTNQYKILALDLDGTLLDAQSRITPENARAVRMAQQAGVQIVLCTGRNVREVRRFSEQLEASAFIARQGSRTGLARHRKRRGSAASGRQGTGVFRRPEHRNGGHHPERVHCH